MPHEQAGVGVILVVDDDEQVRGVLSRILERRGYDCRSAANAREAKEVLKHQSCDLVLCDVLMPDESGLELLRCVRAEHAELPIVMVSGVGGTEVAEIAIERGAYGYVTKPFEPNQVLIAVTNALRRARLELENSAYRENLEELVDERTVELAHAVERLERTDEQLRASSKETVQILSQAIEGRDVETGHHIARMSRYCALLADRAGLGAARTELVLLASPMHDVGKITVPDGILYKPGTLTSAEYDVIKQHAEAGYDMLAKSDEPLLAMAAVIARTHHERWDGTGYAQGLAGLDIPIEGRITAIADVFDALVSRRVYKPPFPLEQAIDIMSDGRATHFDPDLLDLFLEHLDEVEEIRAEFADE